MPAGFAPAKINLALHVVGRRADGYHLLDSLVVFADIGDTVEALPGTASSPRLAVEGPFGAALPADDDNLVLKAARLHRQLRPGPPLDWRLVKRLPVASGLGGGSSDAAAALRLLASLADARPDAEEWTAIALKLGADVPMCLRAAPLRARGIGEAIADWALPAPVPLLLVNPGVAVSTPRIFGRLERRANPPLPDPLPAFSDLASLAAWLKAATRNDLEPPAIAEAPAIADALALVSDQAGALLARVTGSGATVFGIFSDAGAAEQAAEAIRAARPGWWVTAAEAAAGAPSTSRA
jgi:4-diphosphocytidyl-2-C-methyl-D-erythritol kinase